MRRPHLYSMAGINAIDLTCMAGTGSVDVFSSVPGGTSTGGSAQNSGKLTIVPGTRVRVPWYSSKLT